MKQNSSTTKTIDVVSPFNGQLIKTISQQSPEDAQTILSTAHALFSNRDHWLEPHERIAILKKLAALVEAEADAFALLIAQEGGKPLIDAKIEVSRAIEGIHLATKELLHIMRGEEIPMGHTAATTKRIAFTTYEPIGVVLAISAFNHPLNLIVHQVIPAIAVGCPVIIKPASATPLNCLRLCELIEQAGLPKGWCQPIVCNNTTAEKIVTDNRISFFSFIGSAKVGWMLKSKLAPGTRCALEHGGNAPVIVDKDCDIAKVIPALLKGGFYHAGQVCVSVQRIFVAAEKAKELITALKEGAEKLIVGDATLPNTEVGPLIHNKEVDRVDTWVQEAIAEGAQLITGGKKLSDSLYLPTILLNPVQTSKVSQHEVFGPVICIYPYQDRQKAIQQCNSLDVAFQAAVFTDNIHTAIDTAQKLDASAVMINDHTAFRSDWMPFAGRRASGYGIGGIGYTMHDMIQHKMIVINLS